MSNSNRQQTIKSTHITQSYRMKREEAAIICFISPGQADTKRAIQQMNGMQVCTYYSNLE